MSLSTAWHGGGAVVVDVAVVVVLGGREAGVSTVLTAGMDGGVRIVPPPHPQHACAGLIPVIL